MGGTATPMPSTMSMIAVRIRERDIVDEGRCPHEGRTTMPGFFRKRATEITAVDYSTGEFDYYEVVGESYRQDALKKIARDVGSDGTFDVVLAHDAKNPADKNAIMVIHPTHGQIGFLAAGEARQAVRAVKVVAKDGKAIYCHGRLMGGTKVKPSFGVILDLDYNKLGITHIER